MSTLNLSDDTIKPDFCSIVTAAKVMNTDQLRIYFFEFVTDQPDSISTEPEFKQNTLIKSVKLAKLELPDETLMTVKDQKLDFSMLEKELGLSMEEPKKQKKDKKKKDKKDKKSKK